MKSIISNGSSAVIEMTEPKERSRNLPETGGCIGLLALQGDFLMHRQAVEALGYRVAEVRTTDELENIDALIMPGGESTTMRKLMVIDGFFEALREFAKGRPIMGTCAGLVLLGTETTGPEKEQLLGLLDCGTERNAYGRQLYSFRERGEINLADSQESRPFEMVMIRAPKITRLGDGVEVLGRLNGEPTLVRQGNILAMTFHPELSGDGAIHEYFLTVMSAPGFP